MGRAGCTQGVADRAQATLDSLATGGKGLPPTTIMDRLKCSLRKLGYRCQVTLQVWQTVHLLPRSYLLHHQCLVHILTTLKALPQHASPSDSPAEPARHGASKNIYRTCRITVGVFKHCSWA